MVDVVVEVVQVVLGSGVKVVVGSCVGSAVEMHVSFTIGGGGITGWISAPARLQTACEHG